MALLYRSEFFNIFNQPNFGNPNNNLTGPLFGYSTQTPSSLCSGGPTLLWFECIALTIGLELL